jgi:hypothetical protein
VVTKGECTYSRGVGGSIFRAMTDEPAREAADVRSPSETETEIAETGETPRVFRSGDLTWQQRRRRADGGVYAPVDPERRALTPRQDAFARSVAKGVSLSAAARLAGFKDGNEGYRQRTLPHVRRKIHEYRQLKLDKLASASLNVIAEIMLDQDVKAETRLKAAQWVAESAGHGPQRTKDKEKDNENNDMREWSIERLEAFLSERERLKRKAIATDATVIAPTGTMEDSQAVEKTQETHPSADSAEPADGQG